MRWGVAALAGLALTVSVAGCGGSSRSADPSSPVPLSVHTPAEDSSASATPTLDPNSDAAILAAVQAYVLASSRVAQTASVDSLRGVVDPSCPCAATLGSLASQLAAKAWHEDVVFEAENPKIVRRNATNADVDLAIANGPFKVLDQQGRTIRQLAGGSTATTLSFERKGSAWLVFYVDSPH